MEKRGDYQIKYMLNTMFGGSITIVRGLDFGLMQR
jgi:hypothetical protein